MKNILTLSFLLCLFFSSAFGQTKNLILTTEQNNQWLDSLKTQSFDKQLLIIKDRLLADTNVFVRKSYPDKIKVIDSLGNRVYGAGKPTLIIGDYLILIGNKTQPLKIIQLTNFLKAIYIKKIRILSPSDPATTAIYGSSGQFGIIVLTVTKKKYAKLLKLIEL